jgi:hypothetical protein
VLDDPSFGPPARHLGAEHRMLQRSHLSHLSSGNVRHSIRRHVGTAGSPRAIELTFTFCF